MEWKCPLNDYLLFQNLGYSALDAAVSGPLTVDNLDLIRSLLENGANADHRLPVEEPQVTDVVGAPNALVDDGPTLLHAVLGRKIDFEHEEDVRNLFLKQLFFFVDVDLHIGTFYEPNRM